MKIQILSSEGLRRYHEKCEVPAPADLLEKGTWHDHAYWAEDHVDQEDLLQIYFQLWKDLDPVSQATGRDTPEGELCFWLHAACDVVWYAMREDTLLRLGRLVEEATGVTPEAG